MTNDGPIIKTLRSGEVWKAARPHECQRCGREIPIGDPCRCKVVLIIDHGYREVIADYQCLSRCG